MAPPAAGTIAGQALLAPIGRAATVAAGGAWRSASDPGDGGSVPPSSRHNGAHGVWRDPPIGDNDAAGDGLTHEDRASTRAITRADRAVTIALHLLMVERV